MNPSSTRLRLWANAVVILGIGVGAIAILEPYRPYSENSPDFERSRGLAGLDNFEPPFRLRDVAGEAGVRQKYENAKTDSSIFKNEAPRFTHNGAAASVADLNQDGFPDVFASNGAAGSKPWLWMNNRDGTFTDRAAAWGLDGLNSGDRQTGATAFFDFDNDGRQDLFVHRLSGCASFYVNKGGRFEERSDLLGDAKVCGYGTGVNVLDFDRDGYLDVVAIFWSMEGFDLLHPKGTDILWDSTTRASNGSRIYLLRNEKGKGFRDVTREAGLGDMNGWLWSVTVTDLENDGYPDLYFASGWGPDSFYENNEGKFRNASSRLRFGSINSSMGSEAADFYNSGREDIFTAVIYERRHVAWGNNFHRLEGDGRLMNVAKANRTFNCGWAWGPKAVDFDHDGNLELYISNGFISREGAGSYDFEAMTSMNLPNYFLSDDRVRSSNLSKKSYASFQRDCLFYQRHGRFWDLSSLIGLDEKRADGRAVASLDYDNDGRVDLFVVNQASYPYLLKNEANPSAPKNAWLGVTLRAKAGPGLSREAYGARVQLLDDGQRWQMRSLQPNNGYLAQSDARLVFGLGPRDSAKGLRLEVRWPDGKTTTHDVKALNRYQEISR